MRRSITALLFFSSLFLLANCRTTPSKDDNNEDSTSNSVHPVPADTAYLPSGGKDMDSVRTDTTRRDTSRRK